VHSIIVHKLGLRTHIRRYLPIPLCRYYILWM